MDESKEITLLHYKYLNRKDIIKFNLLDRRDLKTGRKLCRCCDNIIEDKRRFYCSDKCRNKVYKKYGWNNIRERILKRDNYKCQFIYVNKKLKIREKCNYSEPGMSVFNSNLEVHHIRDVYFMKKLCLELVRDNIIKKELFDLALMNMYVAEINLITHCIEHHNLVHSTRKDYKYDYTDYFHKIRYSTYIKMNRWQGFLRLLKYDLIHRSLEYFLGDLNNG